MSRSSQVLVVAAVMSYCFSTAGFVGAAGPSTSTVDPVREGLVHPATGQVGRPLTGSPGITAARSGAPTDPSTDEEGRAYLPPPFADAPVIDSDLAQRVAAFESGEADGGPVRLILYLNYHPHVQVFEQVRARHQEAIGRLERRRVDLLAATAAQRDPDALTDAVNYPSMLEFDPAHREQLRALAEDHEALSLTLNREATAEIRARVEAHQAPVRQALVSMGVDVEFGTVAGNLLVVTATLDQVAAIAEIPGLLTVAEDQLMDGDLNVLPAATMVDPDDASLIGLWDTGNDGGVFDPAIIDSGLDTDHPGMDNNVSPARTNYSSWYLVAANGSALFNDAFTFDDLQGHGTAVAGIVGSQGSVGFENRRGIAHGVDKLVNLKAGFRDTLNRPRMFYSDMYRIVERGLNDTGALSPSDFNDDIDGMNLSYGGSTTADDTNVGRFLDSVVSSFPDLPITVSAGNSGPSNTDFSDAASAYNVITVGNANDRNTITRDDDIMNPSSTVGPTANGRRKPDLSTYGTSISAPNHDWETTSDYGSFSGTSASAPVVLGVIMDLADAGVIDELAVKALLINTAQKNLPGISIENDSDGWDPQVGWGVLNAYAAYFHRFDVFQDAVSPRDTAGDFQLYAGTMRDEGPLGEGRDRATMTWNRSATYLPDNTPSTFFALSDINMRLYAEDNNLLLDSDLGGQDNVHQVRVAAGSPDRDVVINVYAWSTTFANGNATEPFALATEEGFTRVAFPTDFQGIALWPTEVEPNEIFDITFWLRNDSDIASHNNIFNLELPAGFTLISGIDTQNVGSAAGEGGTTSSVTYTLRAPPSAQAGVTIRVVHSHNSYNEPYGDFNWNIGLDVAVDNTPPNPNPMAFSTPPVNNVPGQLFMSATFATDIHGPLEYYLDYVNSPSGGTGGTDSGWSTSRNYSDLGLASNHEYCYRAWARDNAMSPNLTTPSAVSCTYTSQVTPGPVQINSATASSIEIQAGALPPNVNLDASGIQFENLTTGGTSAWLQSTGPWSFIGLVAATEHAFIARARNGDGDPTPDGAIVTWSTLANPPAVDSLQPASQSQIEVVLDANGNGPGAEYLIENVTSGVDSGWRSERTWIEGDLACDTPYTYQARARNPDGIETIIINIGTVNNDCSIDTVFLDGFES